MMNGALRWTSIAVFVATPFLVTRLVIAIGGRPVSEAMPQVALFARAAPIDTIIVGDSKVLRVSQDEFRRRGWRSFNLGLPMASAQDVAAALKYALDHAPIARVVIGAPFENMAESVPFESSRYAGREPFDAPDVAAFASADGRAMPPAAEAGESGWDRLLPYGRASESMIVLLQRAGVRGGRPARILADGGAVYPSIEAMIAAGTFDFAAARRIGNYADRDDRAYLAHPALAEHVRRLTSRVLAYLNERRIPTVVFETGRSAAYQRYLDENPDLHRLQLEWRDFHQSQATGCVRFIAAPVLADAYDDNDFFDAVHHIGETGRRIGARLAKELADVEAHCR